MKKKVLFFFALAFLFILTYSKKNKSYREEIIKNAENRLKEQFKGLLPGLCIKFDEVFLKLNDAGFNIHVIGGVIRDAFMNKQSKDIDFAYDRSFKEIVEFSDKVGFTPYEKKENIAYIKYIGSKSCLTDLEHLEGKHSIYNTNIASPHLLEFTVNTMAFDTVKGRIIDKYGGIDDVLSRTIRIPPGVNFDDWVNQKRGLRHLFRFWKLREKGFSPEPKLLFNIRSHLQSVYNSDRNLLLSHASQFFRSRIRGTKYKKDPEEGAKLLRKIKSFMEVDIGDIDAGKAIINKTMPSIGSFKGGGPTDEMLGTTSFKLYDFEKNYSFRAKAQNLIILAKKYEPMLTETLKGIAVNLEGKLENLETRFKTEESALRKLKAKEEVSDILRYTIVFENKGESYKDNLLKSLLILEKKGISLLKLKNSWYPCDPFSAISMKLSWKDLIFEIQFHTQESIEAQRKTHDLYKEYQVENDEQKKCEIFKQRYVVWENVKAPIGVFKNIFPKEEKAFFPPPKGCEIVCHSH